MFSTLLIVVALIGNNFLSVNTELIANRVKIEQNGGGSNRPTRQIWIPSSPYYANFFYYNRFWLSQLAFYSEYLRKRQSLILANAENLFGLSNINQAINPVANLVNSLSPLQFVNNPIHQNVLRNFDSCTDSDGKSGVCLPAGILCNKYGGRSSGSCNTLGSTCCINAVTKCSGQVTLNNTYWESPTNVSSQSSCGLTVTLNTNLIEQKRPICQLRLDLKAFTIAQPGAGSLCATDSFVIEGTSNKIPTICGDNVNQHMYLELPSSTTDVVMLFTFGKRTIARSWNIQITMLPCGSDYLAPSGCLQYYTSNTGVIQSFNWKDVAPTATRQLANQDYLICFRNELFQSSTNRQICLTPCVVKNDGRSFLLSGTTAVVAPVVDVGCPNDFLLIRDGLDPATGKVADRFCGGAFNPSGVDTDADVEVCSSIDDFQILYRTNGAEGKERNNAGFCLTFAKQEV